MCLQSLSFCGGFDDDKGHRSCVHTEGPHSSKQETKGKRKQSRRQTSISNLAPRTPSPTNNSKLHTHAGPNLPQKQTDKKKSDKSGGSIDKDNATKKQSAQVKSNTEAGDARDTTSRQVRKKTREKETRKQTKKTATKQDKGTNTTSLRAVLVKRHEAINTTAREKKEG